MNLIKIIHYFVIIFIFAIPFMPISYIKKGLYLVPFFLMVQYVVFDGCLLTKAEDANCKGFMYENIYSKIFVDITPVKSAKINYLVFITILTIIIYRLIRNKNIE